MNDVEAIRKVNETELALGLAGGPGSWHSRYAHSPVVYVGGLTSTLTEGDVLSVFEQVGRIVHINLVRDADSGKPRGFCFLAYEDARSAVLAVDNFNAVVLLASKLRVDHVDDYKPPGEDAVILLPLAEDASGAARKLSRDLNADATVQRAPVQSGANEDDARRRLVMERLADMRRKREVDDSQFSTHNRHRYNSAHGRHRVPFQSSLPQTRQPPQQQPTLSGSPRGASSSALHPAQKHTGISEDSLRRQKEERKRHRAEVRTNRARRRRGRDTNTQN
jgi:RNA-binding motif protein, X-linked 2